MSVKGEVNNLKLLNVRRHLEDYGADLSAPNRSFIKEKMNMFFEEGEGDDNEGKCTRTRKRKRKDPERCIVSPQLQEIVGEGPEMARAKAVKKVVVYGRKNGLQERCSIFTDDKLKALFPGQSSIPIYQISKYLSLNGHIQPLNNEDMKLYMCIECNVWMKRTRRNIKEHTHHSQRKDMQQNRNLLPREDVRSWDTLPQDILVKILNCCFGWGYESPATTTGYASVSRSWKLAVLELVFPPTNGDVLDLRVLNSPSPWKFGHGHRMFCHYLRIFLNCRPASTWTTLYLPEFPYETRFVEHQGCKIKVDAAKSLYIPHRTRFVKLPHYARKDPEIIKRYILPLIAEKTPELQNLFYFFPTLQRENIFVKLVPYWKNLRKVSMYISADNFNVLHSNCKFIRELSLYGPKMDENLASILGNSFPNLKSLEIDVHPMSPMTNNVLRLILDGHKNLQLLEPLEAQQYVYRFAETDDHVESSSEP